MNRPSYIDRTLKRMEQFEDWLRKLSIDSQIGAKQRPNLVSINAETNNNETKVVIHLRGSYNQAELVQIFADIISASEKVKRDENV